LKSSAGRIRWAIPFASVYAKELKEYAEALAELIDDYNKLTMSADGYKKAAIWAEYDKNKAKGSEYAAAVRDLALAEVDRTGAVATLNKEFRDLTALTKDIKNNTLLDWYEEEKKKVGADNVVLQEMLKLKQGIIDANAAYAEAPLPMDPWLDFEKGKVAASARSDKEISDASKKSQDDLAKSLESIYDGMWKNIQSTFADTIEGMFDKGLDSWDDFFDSILGLFKKMLAQMAAAMK
jgi:hypothetical protein